MEHYYPFKIYGEFNQLFPNICISEFPTRKFCNISKIVETFKAETIVVIEENSWEMVVTLLSI